MTEAAGGVNPGSPKAPREPTRSGVFSLPRDESRTFSGVKNSGGWGVLNVFGCSKSVSGLSMGVLNLTLKVSDERGENMPLSKLLTPPPRALVKL